MTKEAGCPLQFHPRHRRRQCAPHTLRAAFGRMHIQTSDGMHTTFMTQPSLTLPPHPPGLKLQASDKWFASAVSTRSQDLL